MEIITQWVSKEPYERVAITIYRAGGGRIVELDYISDLELLTQEHKAARGAKAKREIAQKYKELAAEINSSYKTPMYVSEI